MPNIIIRNSKFRLGSKAKPLPKSNEDRDDELQNAIRYEGMEKPQPARDPHLSDGPINISHDTLMGKMPKAEKVLMKGDLWKLTSSYEWKPVVAALTAVGLFISRPGEDVMRDLVPLYEVVEVKRRDDIPGESSSKSKEGPGSSIERRKAAPTGSLRTMRFSSLMEESPEPIHVIQLRTIENGYNSGRTYYFKADSEEACGDWVARLRSETDRAVMLKQAGPSLFRRVRYRVRRFYAGVPFQGLVAVLIFSSFLANIVQTELLGPAPAESDPVFGTLEVPRNSNQ